MKARFAIGEIEFHGEGDARATSDFLRSFVTAVFPAAAGESTTGIEEHRGAALALPVPDEPEPEQPQRPKKKRKAVQRQPSNGAAGSRADLIVDFLKKKGPSRVQDIIEGTGIQRGSITGGLKDPRITKVSRGIFQLAGAQPPASPAHDPFDDEDDEDDPPEVAEPPKVARASLTGDMISDALGTGKLSTVDLCSVLKVDRASVLYVLNNDDRFDMDADGNWFVK